MTNPIISQDANTEIVDPSDFHAKMDVEKAAQDHQPEPPSSSAAWTERTYKPWGVTSKKSRRRAKHARQKAIRAWRQRQRDTTE